MWRHDGRLSRRTKRCPVGGAIRQRKKDARFYSMICCVEALFAMRLAWRMNNSCTIWKKSTPDELTSKVIFCRTGQQYCDCRPLSKYAKVFIRESCQLRTAHWAARKTPENLFISWIQSLSMEVFYPLLLVFAQTVFVRFSIQRSRPRL